jgi:hypothetical protein
MGELQKRLKRREDGGAADSAPAVASPSSSTAAPTSPLGAPREPVDAKVFRPLESGNDDEVKKVKRALLTLQAQTKAAVEGMLQRIDHQQKERLKLVAVVRDLKATVVQQQEVTKLLEQQTRFVYQELQKMQAEVLSLKK